MWTNRARAHTDTNLYYLRIAHTSCIHFRLYTNTRRLRNQQKFYPMQKKKSRKHTKMKSTVPHTNIYNSWAFSHRTHYSKFCCFFFSSFQKRFTLTKFIYIIYNKIKWNTEQIEIAEFFFLQIDTKSMFQFRMDEWFVDSAFWFVLRTIWILNFEGKNNNTYVFFSSTNLFIVYSFHFGVWWLLDMVYDSFLFVFESNDLQNISFHLLAFQTAWLLLHSIHIAEKKNLNLKQDIQMNFQFITLNFEYGTIRFVLLQKKVYKNYIYKSSLFDTCV